MGPLASAEIVMEESLPPNKIPKEDIISQMVNSSIYLLPSEQDNPYTATILRKTKPPSPAGAPALQNLNKDTNIITSSQQRQHNSSHEYISLKKKDENSSPEQDIHKI